jgi:hypothetical protein
MNQLLNHNNNLKDFFNLVIENQEIEQLEELVGLDNIDNILREYLSVEEMREAGSFFTGQSLATTLVKAFNSPITFNSVVLDPTCGAGNLLIESSRELGLEESLSSTLEKWGKVLWGYDIHNSFIEATKLRIILEALRRGVKKDCDLNYALSLLPNIRVENALNIESDKVCSVTHTIMNPPFSSWQSPQINYWKHGKVNAAGIVFDRFLRILPTSCEISAILPDVLRSGSRYENFRNFTSNSMNGECKIWGRFNSKTDVDVFTLSGSLCANEDQIKWFKELEDYTPLSEFYDVRIGPLVAYRDPEIGPYYPYIHPKNSPKWESLKEINETRKFKGTVITPPFVVINRTSSPSDKYRASGTIILGKIPVAVENHMIIIKPKNGKISDCKKLLKILKSEQTNLFLNERIRLRHLTVGVVKDIPFSQGIL